MIARVREMDVAGVLGVGIAGAMVFGAGEAQADTEERLQYEVCESFDAKVSPTNVMRVLVANGYTTRQAADIVHDAVMDHCIEHYDWVWD